MNSDTENNSEAILEKTAINMLKEKLDDALMALLHESDFGHNAPFPKFWALLHHDYIHEH